MAEQELFDPLDPLGPAYGNINQPLSDIREFTPFEGDRISMPKIDFPEVKNYYQGIPNVDKLNRPNLSIKNDLIYTNRVNPSIAQKPLDIKQQTKSVTDYLDAISQSNQQKNSYAKIYSYNAGPDGNAFMKRYKAYGNETFEKIGFSPLRDNEANFNARTTKWDDYSRMMTHSFGTLFSRGFVSGPKSLAKMLKGDFFSADLEDARVYEEAAAIGQSSKGGIMGFVNNTVMNFGYTAGIITEAIAEEAVGALFAAPTGGSSLIATTANNLLKIPRIFKGLNSTKKGYEAVRNTLNLTSTVKGAREFWNASRSGQFLKGAGRALNPLENTMHAFRGFKNADNLSDLAILSKTAGGLYRDVRKINMALSEARLEAGMVENHVYNKLYNEAYIANNNEVPSNKELAEIEKQSKDASYETLLENTAIIYVSNSIVFRNITGPRGGVRNFIKSTTDDVMDIASREGQKNFGKIGKIVYDKAAKKFILEKNNLKTLAKGFIKNPLYKSVGKTVGYFKANFTEGIQENLQETIAQANQNYFLDSYQSPTLKTMLYSRAATRAISRNKSDYFSDAWSEQNPFTAKGFETFASGFAMGALAGPLNAAVPFLSSNWNRMYDKEAYTKWKNAQTNVATDLVKKLNDMDMGAFISENNQNLGKQDTLSQVRNRASKKEGLDAENEIFVGQVRHLKQTGTFEIFKEKLESFKELSDVEFADAVNIDIEQVPKYRSRIDNSVERLDKIQTLYDRVERKNPNPINYSELNPEDANFEEKLILYNAWEQTNENMVFFNEVYDDALKRRSQIETKYNSNPKYKNIDNKEKNLLFRPEDMSSEIDMLTKELEVQKELGTSPKKIKEIEEKIKITKDYFEKYFEYDKFFNRGSYSQNIADIIKETTGVEATDQDIIDYMNTNIGSKDDEQLKLKIKNNLRQSHKNYVKKLAELKGGYIFDEDTNDTFELLDDYYTLNLESKAITKYIEILNDPDAFLDVTRRNADWMRYQSSKRVKYFEDVISSEMDKVRNNALLNELANKGYYMSAEDMEEYFINGTPPKEIFNNITKEIYLPGSKEYIEIYQEYFAKREELKSQLNPKKTGIIDEVYQKQIDDLITERDAEIEKLPKSRVRVEQDKIVKKKRNETFSIAEVNEQLAPNEYVELKTKDSKEFLVLFMDEAGVMHYDNIDGEIVDITKIKDRYTEGNKFTFEMLPSEIEVEKISNIYKEKIKDVFKAYNEDKNNLDIELPFEEIDSDTNLDTPDLSDFREDLYNKYQQEYVANLPLEEQELLAESPELDNETFEKWYSQEENKKYFDEYNNQNRPEISEKEMIFTYRGQDIDTRNLKLQDLISKRDDVNDQITALEQNINLLDDVSEKKEKAEYEKKKSDLELDVKNLNKIIAARQFSIFPKNVQDSVKRIQKLFKAQKQVETMVEVTEDDKITGLKKGQKSYRINGLFHRRMTNAMQDVVKKKYKYPGLEDLSAVFNLTIGAKGLNKSSISNFVSQLRTLSASSEDKLKGTNDLFFDKLEKELLLLDEKTPQQIKLEIKKSEILEKAEKETDINKINTLYNEAVEIQNKIDGVTTPTTTDTKADIEIRRQTAIRDRNKNSKTISLGEIERMWNSKLSTDSVYTRISTLLQIFTKDKEKRFVLKGEPGYEELISLGVKPSREGYIDYDDAVQGLETRENQLKAEAKKQVKEQGLKIISDEARKESDKKLFKEINAKYDAELAALEGTETDTTETTVEDNFDTAIKQNTTIDIVNSFFAENTYQDGRDAGNFFDLVKDYLETGKKPAFDEQIITQEAYNNLFDYLKDIKNLVDSGEFYLVGNGLVVWDSNILDSDTGRRDRIAGEIDIILANKDGIFVVDIKSGEESKFLNFNSYKLDKETFSKRNEYTIQTAGYATMLEKMIDEKIAGIAMLPIQRTSDKQTNKVIEAGKPTSSSIYNNVEYLRDSEGKIIENKFFDKEFKVSKEKYKINFLVPLDRNSVEEEMNKLFPKDKNKLEPGAKRALKIKFDFYRKQIDSITDENTEQNKQKIENIKTAIEKFSNENNVSFPADILEDINTKLSTLKKYNSVETIDTLIKKYKERLNKSNESLELLTDKLKNISVAIDFNNINESLDDNSSFITKQLEDDALFKEYFDKHKLFIGKTNISTVGQNLAIDVMLASKLLSKNEVKDNLNLEEASDLIHEGVKRIQYLKINSSTDISLKDFNAYQMDIFKLISEKKSNLSNNNLYNLFVNSKGDSELGYSNLGISSINTQLAKINDEINSKFTKENVKKALEFIEKDMINFRDALVDVYESPSIDVGIDIAQESVEEEGTLEEIEIEQELAVGDKVYSIEKDDNSVYVIKNITTKNITLSNELGKEVTIEISKFDEQYITEANMLSGKDDSVYNTTNEEESFIEDSQKTINDFVTNPTLKSESNSNAVDKTQSALRKDLLNKTKDCQ